MKKFFNYKYGRKMFFIFAAIGTLFLIVAQCGFSKTIQLILMIIGAVFVLGGYLWMFILYKCPHCDTRFPWDGGLPNHCPSCGEKLN